jgi:hypothetical protein
LVRVRTTRYRVIESDDVITQLELTDKVANVLRVSSKPATVDSNITLANEIVQRIADGLIDVPNWFKNNITFYTSGQISASEFVIAFNNLKGRGIISEEQGATTQAVNVSSTQVKEIVTVLEEDVILVDRPVTLEQIAEISALKPTVKNNITQAITGLFMVGVGIAFFKGLKK